ncbi:hypothetical protein TBR22_A19140 [Luteitalea sp. TBR-22]|uniref:restriction endonuclease subunit S n=1 Tax=Luteitalea sp. TBR-22 TaxID=2802971 RepID=UPI001AF7A11F|nr:restriction endonuclease subunit S [Luteitalea sp. TBR-22]BCS32692.1 hypothetical protein TBR22_A19140 [Luteitalea sp. TBR-22]
MVGEEWLSCPFADVIDFQEGPGILAKDFHDSGVPLIRLSGLDRGASLLSGCNFLDPAMVRKRWAHFALQQGDILLSTSASLGRLAVVGEEGVGAIAYTGLIRMRPKDGRLVASFIRYLLEGPEFQKQVEAMGAGSVIRHFGPMHLRQMHVTLPPVVEQQAIVSLLAALDGKIDLNRRMSETLEAMALTIFAERVQGRGQTQKARELIARGLLEIGDGYRAKNSELGSPGLPFIRAGNLNGEIDTVKAERLCDASAALAGSKTSKPGDVVFTSKGTVGRFARVTDYTPECVYSPQVCYWRSLEPRLIPPSLLFLWMKSADMMRQIMAVAGQTDMAPYVSLRDQRQMDVPLYSGEALRTAELLEPMLHRQAVLFAENRTLASLRDLLLPKLISGELRIKVAEKLVEAAPA